MQTKILDLTNSEIEITEDTELLGLFICRGSEETKSKLAIKHLRPNLKSRIQIKAVVYDQAKFDLEAKVVIEDGARNTDTYLKVDALIMSSTARARAVPSLEIKEDEVKGGHGATVGQVDSNQLHYLQSRGFSRIQAEELLVEAFVKDISEKIASVEK